MGRADRPEVAATWMKRIFRERWHQEVDDVHLSRVGTEASEFTSTLADCDLIFVEPEYSATVENGSSQNGADEGGQLRNLSTLWTASTALLAQGVRRVRPGGVLLVEGCFRGERSEAEAAEIQEGGSAGADLARAKAKALDRLGVLPKD